MLLRSKTIAIAILLLLGLPSCTSYEVEDHSLQFNQAVGSLGNRLLLLNAVRAAKGYPMQFSKLQTYTGQGRADGGVIVDVPFLVDTVGHGTLAPTRLMGGTKSSMNARTGVNALQLVDLNTAEAQKALRTQATKAQFEYYLAQAWPFRLVVTVMIEGIAVSERLLRPLEEYYVAYCAANPSHVLCNWLRGELEKCGASTSKPTRKMEPVGRYGETYFSFGNDPRTYCEFVAFQWFIDAMAMAGGSFEIAKYQTKKKSEQKKKTTVVKGDRFAIDVNVKLPDKDDSSETAPGDPLDLFFDNERFEGLYQRIHKLKDRKGMKLQPIEVNLRSPERMVRFLGDIISVQELAHDRQTIKILHNQRIVELLRVKRGPRMLANVAVAVTDAEGEEVYIPVPDHGSPTAHLSLQTMALVMDFLNSAVSGKALPQPTTVFVTGG
jgi:hypothetical protein